MKSRSTFTQHWRKHTWNKSSRTVFTHGLFKSHITHSNHQKSNSATVWTTTTSAHKLTSL